jgi:3-oxoacyl-[acyl-carrier-protein] synthase III
MAQLVFEGIGITGLAAAVPARQIDNLVPTPTFTAEIAASVVEKTGIRYRRAVPPGLCASDLCAAAADRLLNEMQIDRTSIDAIILVTQTPDYRMPATALLLQHRLGLSKTAGAFDINLGCSGYVYGLSVAFSLAANPGMRRVLLLNGETRTRAYSMNDRATGLLFGDAGTATLIEKQPAAGSSHFSMNSDGGRAELIMIKSGGYRNPSTAESLVEKVQPDGGMRSEEQGVMNGAGVFEFLIEEVPADIRRMISATNTTAEDFDYFVFHQANRFMNEHLRRKFKIPPEKMPYSLDRFGNTSGVSIPLTMAVELKNALRANSNRLFLCGFGVGLSWGSAMMTVPAITVPDLVEVGEAAIA